MSTETKAAPPSPEQRVLAEALRIANDETIAIGSTDHVKALAKVNRELLAACELALGAFKNNNAIDWNVLEQAIRKAKGEQP